MHEFDVTSYQILYWTQAKFHYEFNWLDPLLYLISRITHLFINYPTLELFYNYQNTPCTIYQSNFSFNTLIH